MRTAVAPTARVKESALPSPYAKKSLAAENTTSLSVYPSTPRAYSSAVRIMLEWTWTVPFGIPVEPEEYSQKQASSQVVGAGGRSGDPFASTSLNAVWPAPAPDTMTCL